MSDLKMVTLTEANFANEVLQASTPVLVDFWAEWCGPCKSITPIIDELAVDYDRRVKFCKINVDEEQKLATTYGIRAIPTLLIFKFGDVVDQVVGFRSKRDLKANLDKYLAD